MPFGITFRCAFAKHRDLLNCNKHGTESLLLPLGASPFRIEFPSKSYIFLAPFLARPFPCFFRFYENFIDFGDPFKIQWTPKWRPESS